MEEGKPRADRDDSARSARHLDVLAHVRPQRRPQGANVEPKAADANPHCQRILFVCVK